MDKKLTIKLRYKVKYYAEKGLKNTEIAKKLGVSRKFVVRWKNIKNVEEDNRGWKKGRKRKYTDTQENMVIQKRKELEDKFFLEQKLFVTNYLIRKLQQILSTGR